MADETAILFAIGFVSAVLLLWRRVLPEAIGVLLAVLLLATQFGALVPLTAGWWAGVSTGRFSQGAMSER